LTNATLELRPLSWEYQRNPYPYYERLRESPAVWVPELNAWFVGRHADVLSMEKTPEIFSHARFEELSRGEFRPVPGVASILSSDPPEHSRLRQLARQAFLPAKVRSFKDAVTRRTQAALDGCSEAGPVFDLQGLFANRIPVEMICEILGADDSRSSDFKQWTADILSAGMRATMSPAELGQIRTSVDNAEAYFRDLIEHKRQTRGSDMISTLLAVEEDGERLTVDELRLLAIQLLVGGDETTAHLLTNTLVCLWRNPDQFELVKNDHSLIPNLVEESLRYESPVQTGFLTTTRDVDLDGVEIEEGAAVIAVWGSANRDPEAFPDPDRFDVTRNTRSHMAFGHGAHFCLGAALARLEAQTILPLLFERFPDVVPANPDDELAWIPSYWLRGLLSLRVAV
jgi:cytochrome P450